MATLRERIQFYLIDCKTAPGKLIDIFIIALNLLVCLTFVIDTYPITGATHASIARVELVITIFFIIEYLARLYGSRNRLRHITDIYSIIDLIAILPAALFFFPAAAAVNMGFVRIIRVFRVFRILRFLRFFSDPHFFFGSITTHLLKVGRLLLTILIIFFVSSGLFWTVEYGSNPHVTTFGDAFYFTVVTLTTVGFGDIIPESESGRWITVLMILSGIILIPWQAGLLAKEWMLMATKRQTLCGTCGLKYHDRDASHCKSCGAVIYQEFDGN